MNKILWCALAAACLPAVCCLSGCDKSDQVLHTGSVNSTVILQRDSKYQELSKEYLRERLTAAEEVQKLVKQYSKNGVLENKEVYKKLLKIQEDVEGKWQKKTGEYIDNKMLSMRESCEKIAAEKKLDLVVIDSGDVPTVEYGAHDITENVLASMSQSAAPAPAESGEKDAGKAETQKASGKDAGSAK